MEPFFEPDFPVPEPVDNYGGSPRRRKLAPQPPRRQRERLLDALLCCVVVGMGTVVFLWMSLLFPVTVIGVLAAVSGSWHTFGFILGSLVFTLPIPYIVLWCLRDGWCQRGGDLMVLRILRYLEKHNPD